MTLVLDLLTVPLKFSPEGPNTMKIRINFYVVILQLKGAECLECFKSLTYRSIRMQSKVHDRETMIRVVVRHCFRTIWEGAFSNGG